MICLFEAVEARRWAPELGPQQAPGRLDDLSQATGERRDRPDRPAKLHLKSSSSSFSTSSPSIQRAANDMIQMVPAACGSSTTLAPADKAQ